MSLAFTDVQSESRYSRQQMVPGWNQQTLESARVLVVGAGALGNEVLKNLVLSGVGTVDVADHDRVELSNLSRCVLFGEGDIGKPKAHIAAARLQAMHPGVRSRALEVYVEHGLGAGTLRDYDLVLGAVDNIGARLALNGLCRSAGVPWIDGGMDAGAGQISFFDRNGPCYECGLTASMQERLAERQSCLRLGTGDAAAEAKMAATVTMAALLGALQAQEAIRWLLRANGQRVMQPGQKICVGTQPYDVAVLQGKRRPDCGAHGMAAPEPARGVDVALCTVLALLETMDAERIELGWDVVSRFDCVCGAFEPADEPSAERTDEPRGVPLFATTRRMLQCPACGRVRSPDLQSSIARTDALAACTLQQLGVPPGAILELVRSSGARVPVELLVELQHEAGAQPEPALEVFA